jgi:transposase
MKHLVFAGIDVSLATLTVAVRDQPSWTEPREFANTKRGHQQLISFLQRCGAAVQVCLEPTSTYHLALCYALHEAPGCTVYVADPKAVRDFALSRIKRAKTDRCDARELADYLRLLEPTPWQPPRPVVLHLRCLARRAADVTQRCTALKNQRHAAAHGLAPKTVLRDLQRELRDQGQRLRRLRGEMRVLVRSDALLEQRYQLLLSVVGIGEVVALKLLAELSMLPEGLSKRQWIAAAGLDPQPRESGKMLHPPRRLSKRGNARLRYDLFIPALVATRYCPAVQQYYEKLLARGCAKLAALCAVMRKLLQAIWGMFQTNMSFDPARFCQPTR